MLTFNFAEIPWWYILIACILTIYYAIRGCWANYLVQKNQITTSTQSSTLNSSSTSSSAPSPPPKPYPFTIKQAFIIYSLHDALFHLICGFSGFFTLSILCFADSKGGTLASISAGDSILFVFLSVYSILGVTGMLPQLIQQGKIPGLK